LAAVHRPRADERVAVEKEAGMDTIGEYRQRAATCLRLANESRDAYVRVALTELAIEFSSMADAVETCGSDDRRSKMS
jgi:predicted AAA+ superfamily ATPase